MFRFRLVPNHGKKQLVVLPGDASFIMPALIYAPAEFRKVREVSQQMSWFVLDLLQS